jgi:hypothetical protein
MYATAMRRYARRSGRGVNGGQRALYLTSMAQAHYLAANVRAKPRDVALPMHEYPTAADPLGGPLGPRLGSALSRLNRWV